MNRYSFITSKHRKHRFLKIGCRVRPKPNLKPYYYWNDDLRGKLTAEHISGSVNTGVWVQWDGYAKVALCEREWLTVDI